jgi:hypothetical protein
MTWPEIVVIVAASVIVVGVVTYEIMKHKSGKSSCDCCSGSSKVLTEKVAQDIEKKQNQSTEE